MAERVESRRRLPIWTNYFRNESTMHGIHFIFEKKIGYLRKTVWFLLICGCFTGFMWNTVNHIITYFFDEPVNVDISFQYLNNMPFPEVTLCNFNRYRISAASKMGYFEPINDLYNNGSVSKETENFFRNQIEPADFALNIDHQKEDFIYECRWGASLCSPKNFSNTFTGLGVCYFLKHPSNGSLLLSEAGIQNGLSLTLNVEQYEYMRGPMDRAGVKALVHSSSQFPRMDSFGFSVPPGMQALTTVSVTKLSKIPNHGDRPCGEKRLHILKAYPYSFPTCYQDCLCRNAMTSCQCMLLVGESKLTDKPNATHRYCDPYQEQICVRPAGKKMAQVDEVPCDCRESCEVVSYTTSTSYALMSTLKAAELARQHDGPYFTVMETKLINARNARAREEDMSNDQHMFQQVLHAWSMLKNALDEQPLPHCLKDVEHVINFYHLLSDEAISEIQRTTEDVFISEKTFMIAVYVNSLWAMKSKLKLLATLEETAWKAAVAEMQYLVLDLTDDIHRGSSKREIELLFEKYPFFQADESIKKFYDDKEQYIEDSVACFKSLMSLLRNDNPNGTLVKLLLQTEACLDVQLRNEDLRQHQAINFYNYLQNMQSQQSQIFHHFSFFSNQSSTPQSVSSESHKHDQLFLLFKQLFQSYESGNITKLQLAEAFTAEEVVRKIKLVEEHEVPRQTESFKTFQNLLLFVMERVESLPEQTSEGIKAFYRATNESLFHKYFGDTGWLSNLTQNCSNSIQQQLSAKRDIVRLHQSSLGAALGRLLNMLIHFKKSCKVSPAVVLENFAQLNIFYPELIIQNIVQQKAFGFWALLSNVGGGMGLFLGASFITVFELFDVLLQVCEIKNRAKKKSRVDHDVETL